MDLGGWLRSLGLGKYEAAFRENEITEKVLRRDVRHIAENLAARVEHRRTSGMPSRILRGQGSAATHRCP
jgi:hypothetical protein